MVALLIVAGAVCFWGFKSGDSRSFQIAKNLDIFNSIVKELDMFYVDTIDPNKTIREGIDAMLYSLDPYTEYYPEDDQSALLEFQTSFTSCVCKCLNLALINESTSIKNNSFNAFF